MSINVFLSTLNRVVDRDIGLGQVIDAAATLEAAGEIGLAERLYEIWLSFNPEDPSGFAARFNSAALAAKAGRHDLASERLERLIAEKPDFAPAYINLGNARENQGKLGEAVAGWSALVARLSAVNGDAVRHKISALHQMCRVLTACHRPDAAETLMRTVLDIDQNDVEVSRQIVATRMLLCEWPVMLAWSGLTRRTLTRRMHPLSMLAHSDDPAFQLALAHIHNQEVANPPPDVDPRMERADGGERRRIRIGYLSSDLRDHAIGYLMVDLLETHHREDFEIFAYYCGPPNDSALHDRIKGAVEHWTTITGLDDATAARRLAADDLDILVDVNGYTRDSRDAVVAARPAPIIVNWLGYPGTLGSPHHHYIVADEWIIPPELEKHHSEKVKRLPCYQPSDRRRQAAPPPTRRELGLPEDGFVYCCFNGSQKFTPFMFDRWMTILRGVPGSTLWLLSTEAAAETLLRARAEAGGVDPGRVVFAGKMSNPEHLARHAAADLFLDTSPYGAHTTANDALWMGVPLLTVSGRSFASRVCGSLVRTAGIPEMVCATFDEYVERAIAYGNDPDRLRPIRDKLRAGRGTCVLFDVDLLTSKLEDLYREMIEDERNGRLPIPDLTNLDFYFDAAADVDRDVVEVGAVSDYDDWFEGLLAARHAVRPRRPDDRLWTESVVARRTGRAWKANRCGSW